MFIDCFCSLLRYWHSATLLSIFAFLPASFILVLPNAGAVLLQSGSVLSFITWYQPQHYSSLEECCGHLTFPHLPIQQGIISFGKNWEIEHRDEDESSLEFLEYETRRRVLLTVKVGKLVKDIDVGRGGSSLNIQKLFNCIWHFHQAIFRIIVSIKRWAKKCNHGRANRSRTLGYSPWFL